jgi:hypothetical protein
MSIQKRQVRKVGTDEFAPLSNRVAFGESDRKILVPDSVRFPEIKKSIELIGIDAKISAAARSACVSSRNTIIHAYKSLDDNTVIHSYPAMRDELSPYLSRVVNIPDMKYSLNRCLREYKVWSSEKDQIKLAINGRGLQQVMGKFHRLLRAGTGELRKTGACLRPDERGNSIVFPNATKCEPLIGMLEQFLLENAEQYPGLSAVVGLVAVVHIHPFSDGNGRTARTLFNALLSGYGEHQHFVPIALLSSLSEGGYLLKLRRAMYGGDWEAIGNYFASAIKLSAKMQKIIR